MSTPSASSSTSSVISLPKKMGEKFGGAAILAIYTPFVVCLTAGDLSIESFRYFIAQDVHLLRAFSNAFQIVEDSTDDDSAKEAIADMRDFVLKDLETFDSFVEDWDTDLIKNSPINPATTKYTDFLSAITSGRIDVTKDAAAIVLSTPFEKTKISPYALSAIIPCMRFYFAIATKQSELKGRLADHPYKKWIDKYSCKDYELAVKLIEDLLDELSISLTTVELEIVEKLYLQAMRLKMEFLNAQTISLRTVVPLCKELKPTQWHLLLFSAFDLTCTDANSCVILPRLSLEVASKKEQIQPAGSQVTAPSSAELKERWKVLSEKYKEGTFQYLDVVMKFVKDEKFSRKRLCKALKILSDFEKKTTTAVIKSKLIKGVKLEHINKIGEGLLLKDGCGSFLQELVQKEDLHVNVAVLSSCWCGDLIRSALSAGGLQAVNVHSNELIYDNDSVTTGDITRKVVTSFDKFRAFNRIYEDSKADMGPDNKKLTLTVYIGYSSRDLLGLLEADIGIVLGSESCIRMVGKNFGVSFVPLFDGLVQKQIECTPGGPLSWNRQTGVLYTASNWGEVRAFILGL